MPDGVAVRLGAVEQPERAELGHHPLAGVEAVESLEARRDRLGHPRLGGHDVDRRHPVPLPDFEVERIVGGGELDRAGPELRVHRGVGDHGDQAVGEGKPDQRADQVPIARVVGVHPHAGVAQHRLGTGGRHDEVTAPLERVPDPPDAAVLLFLLRLLVGERGETARAPVDDVLAAIDQVPFVPVHEHLAHRAGEPVAEGVVLPGPVAAGAEGADLPEDGLAGVPDVLLHPGHERPAPDIEAGLPLGGEETLDHVLGGDPRVIGARDPLRRASAHSLEADQAVLDREVEAVAHVEPVGDVGRRHDDDVRTAGRCVGGSVVGWLGRRGEQPAALPLFIERRLESCGIVLGREGPVGGGHAERGASSR